MRLLVLFSVCGGVHELFAQDPFPPQAVLQKAAISTSFLPLYLFYPFRLFVLSICFVCPVYSVVCSSFLFFCFLHWVFPSRFVLHGHVDLVTVRDQVIYNN